MYSICTGTFYCTFWVQYSTVQFSFSSTFPGKTEKRKEEVKNGRKRKTREEAGNKQHHKERNSGTVLCILHFDGTKENNVTSQLFTANFYCDFN